MSDKAEQNAGSRQAYAKVTAEQKSARLIATGRPVPADVEVAGTGVLPGAVWRPGDPDKHLSKPNRQGEVRPRWSPLLETLCGLDASAGPWLAIGEMDDDVWCAACLAASPHEHRVEPR